MISPEDIRDKAKRIYPQAIAAWIEGSDCESFPWRIPANLKFTSVISENIRDVERLRRSCKESIGYGYSVEWERRVSRKFGDNDLFPVGIFVDSFDDLLKLTGKRREFQFFESQVSKLRSHLPELEGWLRSSWSRLLELDAIDDLIRVALFLKNEPRPNCFARELPLSVPTKLIQGHKPILSEWLDALLPDESIDCSCDPRNFEQRYGFRRFRKHVLTRILDPKLQAELQLFSAELSLPPQEIARMPIRNPRVLIVENQVTLLTLPAVDRGIAFFGMGMGITQLFDVDWLRETPVVYWGDLDVQGFQILAALRRHYPKTTSMLMDISTLLALEHLATSGTGHEPETPTELNADEAEVFLYLRMKNLRIEQEHVQQSKVNEALSRIV